MKQAVVPLKGEAGEPFSAHDVATDVVNLRYIFTQTMWRWSSLATGNEQGWLAILDSVPKLPQPVHVKALSKMHEYTLKLCRNAQNWDWKISHRVLPLQRGGSEEEFSPEGKPGSDRHAFKHKIPSKADGLFQTATKPSWVWGRNDWLKGEIGAYPGCWKICCLANIQV